MKPLLICLVLALLRNRAASLPPTTTAATTVVTAATATQHGWNDKGHYRERRTAAQKATINEIQEAPRQHGTTNSPFLSTTLSATITAVDDDASAFDAARKALFSDTLTRFLAKIFHDQQVYAVKIIGVNLFDDHVLEDGNYEELRRRDPPEPPRGRRTRSFTTVVSAEFTREDEVGSITDASFRDMLIHVCDKFQNHLLQFMVATGDEYFRNVDSVLLSEFERRPGLAAAGPEDATENRTALGLSAETLNIASIVAIVVGGIVFFALSFASVKYYK